MTDKPPVTVARSALHEQPTILVQSPTVGILDQARRFGWRVVNIELTRKKVPPGCNVVGAIVWFPFDNPNSAWARELTCPMVRIGRLANPFDDRLPAVIGDYAAAGRLAAEHFAERNFRHVAMVGSMDMVVTDVAWDTFRSRAQELGCDCRLLSLSANAAYKGFEQKHEVLFAEMSQFLQKVPKPIGLFCVSEVIGGRIIIITQSEGLAVPEDVAVLCCGNDSLLCSTTAVPMSQIDMGGERQSREAVRLLRRLVQGKEAPAAPIVMPPAGVVERHSTNVFVVADPAVSRALRLIWDHLEEDVSVNDIARQVGVSRRSLERSFRSCIGRSMTAERQRKRLERCADLLRATAWPIESVAASVGFTSHSYLYRSFRKKFGVTPAEFRKQPGY